MAFCSKLNVHPPLNSVQYTDKLLRREKMILKRDIIVDVIVDVIV